MTELWEPHGKNPGLLHKTETDLSRFPLKQTDRIEGEKEKYLKMMQTDPFALRIRMTKIKISDFEH